MTFEQFVERYEAQLRAGLSATYGPELGAEVTADALTYGWEHWARIDAMANPVGYLYRVGQSAARRYTRPSGFLPAAPAADDLPPFEPGLAPALEALTDAQRTSVILVHALGMSQTDAARLLDVDLSTLRTHVRRGLTKLRTSLKVDSHAR
ncbi:MAG: sigma-70 family RNA polymerase sigma factor [Actinomycetota bacterium]